MKTVVVTGASKGIGKATAIYLSQNGYNVIGIYKSDFDSAKTIEVEYGIKTFSCDVADFNAVDKISKRIINEFGNIYSIVNNAGKALTGLFCDTTDEQYDLIMNTNLKGVFNVTKAFLPQMINQKSGKIVNISSMWGVTGGSCEVVYSASKAGVIGLTKALAKEVGPCGITVNCIAPGVIETDMIKDLTTADKASLAEETPLERLGTANDIAKVVEFLISDKSDFITGQVLNVDGGMII